MADQSASRVEQIAESKVLKLGARLLMWATPFVMALFAWFGTQYIDLKFQPLDELKTRVDVLDSARLNNTAMINDLKQQVAVMQAGQSNDRQSLERWRSETNAKLDRVNENLTTLTGAVSGLNATLNAIQRRNNTSTPVGR